MSRVGSGKGLTDRRILRLVNLIRDRTLREKVQDLFLSLIHISEPTRPY